MAARRLASTTDLTDEEWQSLAPLLPPDKAGGRPRTDPLREVLNGIQDLLRGGWAWRLMPHGQTADQTCRAWRRDGTWVRLPAPRRARVRTHMGRPPQPSAASIDAQTVKTTATGGRMAMTAPNNSRAAHAISSWRRRVSCGASSSIPPS